MAGVDSEATANGAEVQANPGAEAYANLTAELPKPVEDGAEPTAVDQEAKAPEASAEDIKAAVDTISALAEEPRAPKVGTRNFNRVGEAHPGYNIDIASDRDPSSSHADGARAYADFPDQPLVEDNRTVGKASERLIIGHDGTAKVLRIEDIAEVPADFRGPGRRAERSINTLPVNAEQLQAYMDNLAHAKELQDARPNPYSA